MNLLDANDRPGAYPESWYAASAVLPAPRPRLEDSLNAEICVIGGGYTGLSAALHLARRDHDVVLIEAQRVGFGASGRNGGQVGSGQRLDQIELERRLGADDARKLWQLGEDAKALVRGLVDELGIDARWRPGVAHVDERASGVTHAHALAEKLARDYGYEKVEPLDEQAVRALIGSRRFRGGLIDWGAGHIHPLRFALGLAQGAEAAGARLFERTRALRISERDGRRVVTCDGGEISAEHVVVAANGYLGGLEPHVARRVMPINNFIVATEPLGERAQEILARDIAVADGRFVVSYWRLSEDGRLLFGGGESYGYRFPADIAAIVRKPMLRIYPQLAGTRIDYAWGGTLAITRTRLPAFFCPRPAVWSASGYSGHGVALATLAGRILADAIEGEDAAFRLMGQVLPPPFPGGRALRSPLLALAMGWFGLRDRLGI
ncbi:gamma-glutamylputrescine oxidase [Meinhardsimonia xiamenensis]|jgi:gamma-glutamylputrescine oxidase|uniref:Gamma-glutamylputrescine oxidase n=1 Tax=Meinhardsimonia xiamenensis TaxID=990712 RepID=A0A1G9B149_9RHOB|nr:FAD-binding oxidoreductase [Meinhardsimonia xiamenensis]PRX35180.1 gamma-glutamylputrescine oxidase [Meinhardsimonia xiamenensis]SDK32834.1 gamma-glutamylputrescine oxidase [Meinhardsimonia xiamenensis]